MALAALQAWIARLTESLHAADAASGAGGCRCGAACVELGLVYVCGLGRVGIGKGVWIWDWGRCVGMWPHVDLGVWGVGVAGMGLRVC